MKKHITRLWSNSKGSVSLFFIIIVAVVFLFNAVLIDYVRIMAAEQQTEYAIQSATRSAMAAFDRDLKDAYGLFGIDEGELSSFETILRENLEVELAEGDNAFRFTNIEYVDSSPTLDTTRALANPEILEHQILEDMKYKAPVEIVKGLIEKITFLSEAMKESSAFVDTASEIVDDFNEREEELDDLKDDLEEKSSSYEQLKNAIVGDKENSNGKKAYPEVSNFAQFADGFEDYEKTDDIVESLEGFISSNKSRIQEINRRLDKVEEDLLDMQEVFDELEEKFNEADLPKDIDEYIEMNSNEFNELVLHSNDRRLLEDIRGTAEMIEEMEDEIEELKKEKKKKQEEIDEYEDEIETLNSEAEEYEEAATDLLQNMETNISEVMTELQEMIEKIDKSLELNKQIKETIEENRNSKEAHYEESIKIGDETGSPTAADDGSLDEAMDKIKETAESLDDYVYEEEFFEKTKEHLEKALQYMSDLADEFAKVNKTEIIENNKSLLDSVLGELQDMIVNIDYELNEANVYFKEKLKEMREKFKDQDVERTEEEQKDREQQDEDEADENNQEMKDFTKDLESMLDGTEDEIYDRLEDILTEVGEYVDGIDSEMDFDSKPKDSAKDAMKLMDKLFSGIGDMLVAARDELYVNEYILYYFESAEPSLSDGFENFKFENREVEYILYGFHETGANYTAALSQLSALRFALNFISAFTDPQVRAAGHPLAVFVAALAYALGYTVEDMKNISTGKSDRVELLRRITREFSLTYKEYLRLFLFMNPGGDSRLQRVATVIGYHNANLTERHTYLNGEVETSIELWFLPEAVSLLGLTGILHGEVNGNEYTFRKKAVFSY